MIIALYAYLCYIYNIRIYNFQNQQIDYQLEELSNVCISFLFLLKYKNKNDYFSFFSYVIFDKFSILYKSSKAGHNSPP